ncbi:MAG: hypothetical protein PHF51_00710 [Candidatus ainarchaeum sp.]|nr:hypothetical protein [Candidatus ainarchaeum sp.]
MATKKFEGRPPEPNCPPGKEFVFRTHDGKEVGKAKNVNEFAALLKTVPLDSVLYHANGGHFAPWLGFMGKRQLADRVRAVKGANENVRKTLIALLAQ